MDPRDPWKLEKKQNDKKSTQKKREVEKPVIEIKKTELDRIQRTKSKTHQKLEIKSVFVVLI